VPLAQDPRVTIQLQSSGGGCWSQAYDAPARRNDVRQLKDAR